MHQHYTLHFAKGTLPSRTPTESYFLDPELGHQKGRGSVWGFLAGREACEWGLLSGWWSRRTSGPRREAISAFPTEASACGAVWGPQAQGAQRWESGLGMSADKAHLARPFPRYEKNSPSPNPEACGDCPPTWGSSVVERRSRKVNPTTEHI